MANGNKAAKEIKEIKQLPLQSRNQILTIARHILPMVSMKEGSPIKAICRIYLPYGVRKTRPTTAGNTELFLVNREYYPVGHGGTNKDRLNDHVKESYARKKITIKTVPLMLPNQQVAVNSGDSPYHEEFLMDYGTYVDYEDPFFANAQFNLGTLDLRPLAQGFYAFEEASQRQGHASFHSDNNAPWLSRKDAIAYLERLETFFVLLDELYHQKSDS